MRRRPASRATSGAAAQALIASATAERVRRQAIDVLLDRRLFVLGPERYDVFLHALDDPSKPGPKLRSLLRRTPEWRR